MAEPGSLASNFNPYSVEQLIAEKLLCNEDAVQLKPMPAPTAKLDKEAVKDAERSAGHICRKVVLLDDITTGVKKRYQDAKDNLERLNYEYKAKQKNVAHMEENRAKLVASLDDKRQKATELSIILRREQKRMEQVMKDMQRGARQSTLTGVQDPGALRKGLQASVMNVTMNPNAPLLSKTPKAVCMELQTGDLAAHRGYHCGLGSTHPARAAPRSQSQPSLQR
jgi:hypothetical protein